MAESMQDINLSKSFSKRKFKKKDIIEKDPIVKQRRREFKEDYLANWDQKSKIKTGFTENNDINDP